MPRHLRVEYPGAIYHVTIRGNARQNIFNDDHDRERFLQRLADSVETYGEQLYLFCLMSNHVHLVVETPSPNLRKFMQSWMHSGSYRIDWACVSDKRGRYLRALQ